MPVSRLLVILVIVVISAIATVWIAVTTASEWSVLLPIFLGAAVVVRLFRQSNDD